MESVGKGGSVIGVTDGTVEVDDADASVGDGEASGVVEDALTASSSATANNSYKKPQEGTIG